ASYALAVRRMLRPALKRVGMQKTRGEADAVTLMRPGLLNALGVYGMEKEVLDWARPAARRYLAHPDSVETSVVGAALNLAAPGAGRRLGGGGASHPPRPRRRQGAFRCLPPALRAHAHSRRARAIPDGTRQLPQQRADGAGARLRAHRPAPSAGNPHHPQRHER